MMRLHLNCWLSILSIFLFATPATVAQDQSKHAFNVPGELSPQDPEIRELLGVTDNSCKASDAGKWLERLQKATQLATERNLIGDTAVVESVLASVSIAQGNTDQGFSTLRKALQDSIDSKREVLEADILVSLAADEQLKGNTAAAVDLILHAISLSEKTGNLYGKARALGEQGKLLLQQGKYQEGGTLIDEAVRIDRLNHYRFEGLHMVYRAIFLGLVGRDTEATSSLELARSKAVEAQDVHGFVSAETVTLLD